MGVQLACRSTAGVAKQGRDAAIAVTAILAGGNAFSQTSTVASRYRLDRYSRRSTRRAPEIVESRRLTTLGLRDMNEWLVGARGDCANVAGAAMVTGARRRGVAPSQSGKK